jgi:hypothetical protein
MDGTNKKPTSHYDGHCIKREVTKLAKRLRAISADTVSPDELVNRVNRAIGETAFTLMQVEMPHRSNTSVAACLAFGDLDARDTEACLDRGPQGAD